MSALRDLSGKGEGPYAAITVQHLDYTAPVDRSGTIAAANAAQSLMPANPNRRGLFVQNNSTGDLWLNELGQSAVAGQPSIRIPSGAFFETNSRSSVSILGATLGQAFTAREF